MRKIAILGLIFTLSLHAQENKKDTTLTRTVVVENSYTPVIKEATKINHLPKIETPTIQKKSVVYDLHHQVVSSLPVVPMGILVGEEVMPKKKIGFFNLGFGSNGNADGKLIADFRLGKNDYLKLNGLLEGENANYRDYKSNLGLDYTHQFRSVNLSFGGNLGMRNFNHPTTNKSISDKRHFGKGNAYFALNSTNNDLALEYAFKGGYSYFSARNYLKADDFDKLSEGILQLNGWLSTDIDEKQKLSLGVDFNQYNYSGGSLENYTLIKMNPYYSFNNETFDIRLGAHVDAALSWDKSYRFAPDVSVETTLRDVVKLYFKATGGTIANDYRRMEQYSPFLDYNQRAFDSHERINAVLGLKFSPVSGLWLNIQGGYVNTKNDFSVVSVKAPVIAPAKDDKQDADLNKADEEEYLLSNFKPMNESKLSTAFGKFEITYDYKDRFNLESSFAYFSNSSDSKTPIMFYKPEMQFYLSSSLKVIDNLDVNLSFLYQKKDTSKSQYDFGKDVAHLNIGAQYSVLKNLFVYGKINNLLNTKYDKYYQVEAQGTNLLLGVRLDF